ncbi:MAG: carbohydrate ABC transporter permease, partial [Candidatus Methanomethyliaceae archaeon]
FFMFITSFKSVDEYVYNKLGLPLRIAWQNYREVFVGRNFPLWFMNSTVLTLGSVFLSLVLACLAAYALSRIEFKGRETLLSFIISLMIVPPVIMLIPLFIVVVNVELINTYAGAIIIYTGLTLPFSIYLLTGFFRSIPQAIIDSAAIDGCSSLRTLVSIIIPLSRPAIMTLIVVNALYVWTELLVALVFLQHDSLKTLMVGITVFKSRYNLNVPLTMTGLVMATIPMVVLYIAGQRYFVRGLVTGSLKE